MSARKPDRYRRVRAAARKATRLNLVGWYRRVAIRAARRRCFPAPRQS